MKKDNTIKNQIETGATLLRTLTEKSILKFGRNADIPLWKLLESFKGKCYLIWVYYHCSNINYVESILDQLKINGDRIISKPGKNERKHTEVEKAINKFLFAKIGYKATGIRRRDNNRNLKSKESLSFVSKSAMARRNHGH
jgi:hypothetical protein